MFQRDSSHVLYTICLLRNLSIFCRQPKLIFEKNTDVRGRGKVLWTFADKGGSKMAENLRSSFMD